MLEVLEQDRLLVVVEPFGSLQELLQEGREEALEVHRRHVVDDDADLVVEEVVRLVDEGLDEHVQKLGQHDLFENTFMIEFTLAIQIFKSFDILSKYAEIRLEE